MGALCICSFRGNGGYKGFIEREGWPMRFPPLIGVPSPVKKLMDAMVCTWRKMVMQKKQSLFSRHTPVCWARVRFYSVGSPL